MKKSPSYNEYVNNDVNEGILDMFKKRKKEVEKAGKVNYNPKGIGYDHPDFKKEFSGFSANPEKELDSAHMTLHKASEKIKPLLSEMIIDWQQIKEMMTQQDMVNGDGANEMYIKEASKFIDQLEDVDFKIRKGVW
jgi:hypothetical protein